MMMLFLTCEPGLRFFTPDQVKYVVSFSGVCFSKCFFVGIVYWMSEMEHTDPADFYDGTTMEVQEYFQGNRLRDYLQAFTPFESKRKLQKLVDRGLVKVNGLVRPLSFQLRAGDKIEIGEGEKPDPESKHPDPEILEVRTDVVVLNKYPGQDFGTPANGYLPDLEEWPHLREEWPFPLASDDDVDQATKVYPVYPVPAGASGIVVLVEDKEKMRSLRKQMGTDEGTLKGWAIVDGQLHDSRQISEPITRSTVRTDQKEVDPSGRSSSTKFVPDEQHRTFSFIHVLPESVVNHQERVHLHWIHHPLSVDSVYGYREELLLSEFKDDYRKKPLQKETPLLSRISLHWRELSMSLEEQEDISVEIPIPEDMQIAAKQIRKYA